MAATLKNESIRKNTEKIGFLDQTTKIAEIILKEQNSVKRLYFINISKNYCKDFLMPYKLRRVFRLATPNKS